MTILEFIRLIIGMCFLFFGTFVFIVEIFGVFKMNYVLNRMHLAALGDTLGLLSSIVGLIIISGISFTTVKLICVVVFYWFASPVATHVLADLVVITDKKHIHHLTYKGELSKLKFDKEEQKEEQKEEPNDG